MRLQEIVVKEENKKRFGLKGSLRFIQEASNGKRIYEVKGKRLSVWWYDPAGRMKFKEGEKHCDVVVEFEVDDTVKKLVFVELKGNHIGMAYQQLESTIKRMKASLEKEWTQFHKFAIIVGNMGNVSAVQIHRWQRNLKKIGVELKFKTQTAFCNADRLVNCVFEVV